MHLLWMVAVMPNVSLAGAFDARWGRVAYPCHNVACLQIDCRRRRK